MSKAVLISIQPEWCSLIVSGRKTVELRKTKPKIGSPFKCYIYCTYGEGLIEPKDAILPNHLIGQKVCKDATWGNCVNGKVIGEFVCNAILRHCEMANADIAEVQGLVRREKIQKYANGKEVFGWHISDLVIYDTPKELGEFTPVCRYGQDGECAGVAKVDCPFQERDYNPDGGINIVDCTKRVSRAPQSWCYVEELPKGGTDNA